MSWAKHAIEMLCRNEEVTVRPRGSSMLPKIKSGDSVTLSPCDPAALKVGSSVLVRVEGSDYLHLIKAIDRGRFLIGNNRGGVNGWVGPNAIFGVAVKVESN